MLFENNTKKVKVKLSFGHKAVISSLSKLNIESKNFFYKSCSVWYAIWEYEWKICMLKLFLDTFSNLAEQFGWNRILWKGCGFGRTEAEFSEMDFHLKEAEFRPHIHTIYQYLWCRGFFNRINQYLAQFSLSIKVRKSNSRRSYLVLSLVFLKIAKLIPRRRE